MGGMDRICSFCHIAYKELAVYGATSRSGEHLICRRCAIKAIRKIDIRFPPQFWPYAKDPPPDLELEARLRGE
jgi:hypothetical protein